MYPRAFRSPDLRLAFAGLALLLATMAGACGGDDSGGKQDEATATTAASPTAEPSPTPAPTEVAKGACAILLKSEAAAILGNTLVTSESSAATCDYNAEKYRLTLTLAGLGSASAAKAEIERLKTNVTAAAKTYTDTTNVKGIGDDAFVTLYHYPDGQATAWIVYAQKAGSVLTVSLIAKPGNLGRLDELKGLVAAAVGRVSGAPDSQPTVAPGTSGATPTTPATASSGEAGAQRDQLLAMARSHAWGSNGAGNALEAAWQASVPGLKVNGSAVEAKGAVSVYDNLLNSKNEGSATNPAVFAFAVMDSAGQCAAAAASGWPAPNRFENVDIAGAKCTAQSVVDVLRAKRQAGTWP